MSKVREIAWPEEFVELKRIEESMVCGICYEYMETTVMTPCSHNYCSLCIRKYLHYKSQCPACFHVFFEKDLYINRAMDVLIQHYIKVREKLISLIENRVVYNTVVQQREHKEEMLSTPPVRPVRNNHILKSPKVQEIKQSEPKTPIFPSTSSSLISSASSPKTHKSPKVIPSIAKMFNTPKRKETVTQPATTAVKSVSCPVCSVDISENHVNIHLDACLKREVAQKVVKEKPKQKRLPLPKLVLRVMKDAELRKKMKEFGLPTNGDRRALENRFTRYSTIYNAECDKLEPRPVSELIRQCEMEEKQERKMDFFLVSSASASASSSTSTVRLQIEKDAKEEKIEEAQKNYRLANKSNFDKLIEEVRNRRKLDQAKKSDNDVNATNSSSTPINNANDTENDLMTTENDSLNPSDEIPFNDSDSDEACPLQIYKSDDPMQFLSSKLDNSSPSTSTSGSPLKLSQSSRGNPHHENSPMKATNVSGNIYEVSTDVSTDDEVQASPIRNRKLNRKKVRLSRVSSKPLSSSSTKPEDIENIESETNDSIERNTREAIAKDLCNSIINDFSFEGMSDDSFSEFSNKPEKSKLKVIEKGQVDQKNSSQNVGRTPRIKKTRATLDKSVPEDTINRVILGDFSSNMTDDWSNNRIDDLSAKIVNTTAVDINNASEKKISENAKTEKENNAFAGDEHFQSSTNEPAVQRPVRKRTRPSRYNESQTSKQDVDDSTVNLTVEDSLENDLSRGLKAVTMSDGSLKRRRGRSKINNTNFPTDESLNPPKRPVRRRQTVVGHYS